MSAIRNEYLGINDPENQNKIVLESKAEIIVMRWGRQTGKDTIIEKLCNNETDFVIMPKSMAAHNAEQWEGRSVFQDVTFTKDVAHYIKKHQVKHHRTKRIFLNECAYFAIELIPLIVMLQQEFPKAQIYLIGTPRGGWRLGELGAAGLEFDMICANLELHKVHGWEYSHKPSPRPISDKSDTNTENWMLEFKAGWPTI